MSDEILMKEFLVAFVEQYGFGRMVASSNPDAAAMIACAEWAWFKSRAAIEVELPGFMEPNGMEPSSQDWQNGGDEMRARCWNSIESLGLKVKP